MWLPVALMLEEEDLVADHLLLHVARIWPFRLALLRKTQADLKAFGIVDRVVALKSGLAENEHVRPDLRDRHRHQPCRTRKLLPLVSLHVQLRRVDRQFTHVRLRGHREVPASHLHRQVGCGSQAAIRKARGRPLQDALECVQVLRRDGQVRGARVQDGDARPLIAADVQSRVTNVDVEKVDHPVAHRGLDERHPSQWLEQMIGVVAAKGDLAIPLSVAAAKQDRKLPRVPLARGGELMREAEVVRHRQGPEAQAQDAVKGEAQERVIGHFPGGHDAIPDAIVLVDHTVGRFRANAYQVFDQGTPDLAFPVANGDRIHILLQAHVGQERGIFLLRPACLVKAVRGGEHEMPRAGVKDHPHLHSTREANMQEARVGGLVGDELSFVEHGRDLPPQRDYHPGRPLLGCPVADRHQSMRGLEEHGEGRERQGVCIAVLHHRP
mmetsp:Transcript_20606/g.56261  ORF Transcript_20606/g.56261 Transcript_20606/m.56261 type:complete len:439 (-) Transcript_20606:84-1400(-)